MSKITLRKDWPHAYGNLQELLRELVPHLQRNGLNEPQPLNKHIDPKVTPAQLEQCIVTLTPSLKPMKDSMDLEQKVTGMLLERFINNAQSFKDDLQNEIGVLGSDSTQHGVDNAQ